MTIISSKLEKIRSDLEQFIVDKEIDEQKVSTYSEIIEVAHDEKLAWALSSKLEPLKSIQIYGSYKLIYESLLSARERLLAAKKRGENPTTAELLLPYFQKLILFTKILEGELSNENKDSNFNKIEYQANNLRSDAILSGILSNAEKVDIGLYRKIQKTAIDTTNLEAEE